MTSASSGDSPPRNRLSKQLNTAVLYLFALLAFALYAPSIRLMLLLDDLALLPKIEFRSFAGVFVPLPDDYHYRPLAYLLWWLPDWLFGWFSPPVLHFWNVAFHVLSSVLVAALMRALARAFGARAPRLAPVVGGLIFLVFPFSYQALYWASAMVHPLMTTFGLLGLLLFLSAQREKQPGRRLRLYATSAAALLAAALSNEMGIAFCGIAAALAFLLAIRGAKRSAWLAPGALPLAIAAGYAAFIRQTASANQLDRKSGPLEALQNLVTSLAYHSQAWSAWLILILRDRLGPAEGWQPAVLALFALSLALPLILAIRERAIGLWCASAAFWLIPTAALCLIVTTSYAQQPRLMYAGSAGVALVYGYAVAALLERARPKLIAIPIALAGLALLAQSFSFVALRGAETERLSPALRRLDRAASALPDERPLLLINPPFWTAARAPQFLIGPEGMPLFTTDYMPEYFFIRGVSGQTQTTRMVQHPASFKNETDFIYGLPDGQLDDWQLAGAILESAEIYQFDYDRPGLRLRYLGGIAGCAGPCAQDLEAQSYVARFTLGEQQTTLQRADAQSCGGEVRVNLVWRDLRKGSPSAKIFTHVMDGAAPAQQIGSLDQALLGGYVPFDRIQPGLLITDAKVLRLPAGPAPSVVRLGLYDGGSGARAEATRADGASWNDNEVSLPVDARCVNP